MLNVKTITYQLRHCLSASKKICITCFFMCLCRQNAPDALLASNDLDSARQHSGVKVLLMHCWRQMMTQPDYNCHDILLLLGVKKSVEFLD